MVCSNPSNPHDESKHHFASLKNEINSPNRGVLEHKFAWNCLILTISFVHLSPTSSHIHSLQVENCDSNSRPVEDEYDNGKFRVESVGETGA